MGIVARQATWNTILTTAGMALGFVNMALLFPKYLPTAEFGLTRLLVSIAVVAAQVAQLGGETTMIRYFPYFRDKKHGHNGLFGLMLIVATAGSVMCLAALALFHTAFARWFNDGTGLYLSHGLVVLPLVLSEVYFIILRGMGRSVHRSIAPVFAREFLLRVLQTVLIGVHILWHLPLGTFLLCYVLTFALTTLVVLVDLWRSGEWVLGIGRLRVPRRMARSMVRYSAFTFGSSLASIAVGNIDQVMVGAMLSHGLDYVAYYAVAMFLASLIMVPARALVLPMLPILANAWRKRDHKHITMIYHRTASIQLVSSAFLFLCLLACVDPLFSFLDDPYRIVGKPVLIILGITNVLNLSTGLSGGIVSTSRSYWFDAVSGFLLLGLNVLFDYLFILWWGVVGAAWSSLASVIIVVGWRLIFLRQRFTLWPYDGKSMLAFALIGLCAVGVWYLPHAGSPIVDMLWRCALLTAVYWPLVHVLRIAPELGDQLKKVLRRLSGATTRS